MPTDCSKGRIILTASILCGHCGGWYDLEARKKSSAEVEARKRGYVFTIRWGWLCPACRHFRTCPICRVPKGICPEGYALSTRYGGERWTSPTATATSEPTE